MRKIQFRLEISQDFDSVPQPYGASAEILLAPVARLSLAMIVFY